MGLEATTSYSGRFTLSGVPVGPRTLAVSGLGYRTLERPVNVQVGDTLVTELILVEDPITLTPLTVLGTRAQRPLATVPASITVVAPQEIREQQVISPRIEDLLRRQVPDFNPTNEDVRQIRGRTAQVFINGVPVNEQLRASSGSDTPRRSTSRSTGR